MFIGIDLGGSHIGGGLVNSEGQILYKAFTKNEVGKSQKLIINDMIELCNKIIHESGVDKTQIKAIGIGSPGTCDSNKGIIVYDNKFKFKDAPVRAEYQKYFDIPMYIENDANCAALAEALFGAGKGSQSSVTITLGTGIGGGIVIDGKIFSGFNFAGSELGHNVIVVDGELCTCGRRGCFEAYASAAALKKSAIEAIKENKESIILDMADGDVKNINGEIVFNAEKAGDIAAKKVIERYIKYLAEGLTNIVNILMPEVLIIGGGICNQGDYLLEPLKKFVNENMYVKGETPRTIIRIAQMENDAGIIGAAMLGK